MYISHCRNTNLQVVSVVLSLLDFRFIVMKSLGQMFSLMSLRPGTTAWGYFQFLQEKLFAVVDWLTQTQNDKHSFFDKVIHSNINSRS
jgi:hypothetical protein